MYRTHRKWILVLVLLDSMLAGMFWLKCCYRQSEIHLVSGQTITLKEDETVKKIALTFDDGPHPYYTEQLLDGLKERNVKVTFFVTGAHAELHPDVIKRMYEEGHLIGNHTYSHMQLKKGNRRIQGRIDTNQ